MRFARILLGAALLLVFAIRADAACLAISHAPLHVGEVACVRGRVLTVSATARGTHFLNFCDDYRTCPFSVVVFESDLRQIGDIRLLSGLEIEIDGTIVSYKGRPEIVLKNPRQLRGSAGKLPPVPRDYDVTRQGNFSAGTFRKPRKATTASSRKPQDRTDPNDPPAAADPEE